MFSNTTPAISIFLNEKFIRQCTEYFVGQGPGKDKTAKCKIQNVKIKGIEHGKI
jgi:hypothetical protein